MAQRELKVFHKDTLLRPLETETSSDAFYDFTEADYYRIVGGKDNAEPVLKTKFIRDREEEEAAQKLNPVHIRYVFPDGLICQAQFSALESIQHLLDFMQDLLMPDYSTAFHLFTAPPKEMLRDQSASLFRAKLVPDANIYMEFSNGDRLDSQIVLKPFVLEMIEKETMEMPMTEARDDPKPVGRSKGETTEKRSAGDLEAGRKQVPKWFKMGKK